MSELSLAFDELYPFDTQLSNNQMYFIVSHKNSSGLYESCKISMESLAVQLNSCISSIKSAARCPSSDFALVSHDHDIYTSAMFTPASIPANKKVHVMTMKTSSTQYDVSLSAVTSNTPINVGQKVKELLPKLGTVRFIAVNDLESYANELNYTNSNFSGWVRANGTSTLKINDFMLSDSIPDVFSTSGTTFTVPELTTFFKINGDDSSESYVKHAGHLGLSSHTHGMQNYGSELIFKSYKVEVDNDALNSIFDGKLRQTQSNPDVVIENEDSKLQLKSGEKKYTKILGVHSGRNNLNNYQIELSGSMKKDDFHVPNTGLIANAGVENDIPHPSYNLIPAIVYVGPSKWTDMNKFLKSTRQQ